MPPDPATPARSQRLLARLWRTVTHDAWAAVLTAAALLAGLADTWLPQVPTPLVGNALERGAWLDKIAAQQLAGPLLQALGAFDVAHNPSLRVLLSLLAAALLLRLIDRLRMVSQTRHLTCPDQRLPTLTTREVSFPESAPLPWAEIFAQQFPRWQHTANDSEQRWYGDRGHRWVWAAALAEVGWLVALLALLLNLRVGWQMEGLRLDAGGSLALAPFSSQSLSLDSSGATLRLCCQPDRTAPLAAGTLDAGSVRVQVQEVGVALRLTATDAGIPLTLQAVEQAGNPTTELLLHFPQERSERAVALPARQLFLRIVTLGQDHFRVQALNAANQLLLSQEISGPTVLAADGAEIALNPSQFLVVRGQSRPWLWLLLPAAGLILGGWVVRRRFPYCRAGVIRTAGGAALRWQGQHGARPLPDDLLPPHP